LQSIKEQIQAEAGTARQALRDETEALAKEIAGKVLGRVV
jgi:F0F1-type ATP synthase membrane subunit b/b'